MLTVPDAIRRSWCRETSSVPEEWTVENPARGQCAVTACLLQEMCGGQLLRAMVGEESHYWNLLDNGVEIDLTLIQFGEEPQVGPPELRARDYVLGYPETLARYERLRQRVVVICAL